MSAIAQAIAATPPKSKRHEGITRNQWHQYSKNGGPFYPGATTILRIQDALYGSDQLVHWAGQTAAEAALAAREDGVGLEQAMAVGMDAIVQARDRGSMVHRGIEAQVKDEDHVPEAVTHAYWYAWSRFLIKERPDIARTEQMLINETIGFGGTIDLPCMVRGKFSQIDVKTGKQKQTQVLQLAAYDQAEWWGTPDSLEKPIPFEAHYILLLSPTGYDLVPQELTDKDREHFAYLAATYQRLKAWKKEQA